MKILKTLNVRDLENLFVPVLRDCTSMAELKKIHVNVVKYFLSHSNFLVTKMVDVCNTNRETDYAGLLFRQVIEPNIFLYNAMIRAYTHNHMYTLAIDVYKQLLRHPLTETPVFPDKFTIPLVIKSCAGIMCHGVGMQVHSHLCKFGLKSNSVAENSLIDMYIKCDNLTAAHRVFEEMSDRDVVSWNSLIYGHLKLGQMSKARVMFDEMPEKTIISWTAMISGYSRIGCYADALDAFHQMQAVGINPDEICVIAVLPACSQLGALELGKWIHTYADKNGLLRNTCVCNALIEMYGKCGSLSEACQLFNQMFERDVISWSTMIGGLANHGKAREAIELFAEMERAKVKPNGITFLGLLSACTHAGFLNEGLTYFDSMRNVYHIEPSIEHYGCLVNLLGRAGCLDQALELIKKMPMKPDIKVWGSLLHACRTFCNLEIAVTAMENLIELEPDDTGNYVLLSNIYADLGKWDDVSRIRKHIRSNSMRKTPGCSVIEVDNVVQEFVAGDDSKPFSEHIFLILELLALHQSKSNNVIEIMLEDTSVSCLN